MTRYETTTVNDHKGRDVSVGYKIDHCPGDRDTPPLTDVIIMSVEYEGRDVTRLVDHCKVQEMIAPWSE
jgi:hypothetical protein